jgi:hypothetical protein
MRSIKVLAAAVLGLALCAGTAQASAPSSICDPVGSGSFLTDSLANSGSVAGRGGLAVREPDLGQVHTRSPEAGEGSGRGRLQRHCPVYFHVVTDGRIGSLTNAQIDRQMRSTT